MYQINPSFPPFLYAPPPLLTNQFSALEPRNTPAYYNPPLPRSYPYRASPPYTTPASEYGSSGSAPGFNAACTSDSTTSDSLTPTPVFLTEPRGVHIGNVSLETSETATRRLVARTVQIQDDQIQDQIQDVSLPTNGLGKQKGYATVCFDTREMAELAKDAFGRH